MGLHVLVVARWYPAFDNPSRGSFVADHVAALAAAGVRSTVVSFEPLPLRGDEASRPARGRAAGDLIDIAIDGGVRGGWATAAPRSWGAPGTEVARLPVLTDATRRDAPGIVAAHAAPLTAFGLALVQRAPIDLVHAHTGLPDGIAAARLADRLGVPLLVTEHASTLATELADADARRMYRELVAPRRCIAAVSAVLCAEVAALIGIDPSEIAELPNAVPIERFPSGSPDDRDAHELLYVAARRGAKGIETLLRAFARIRETRPEAHLRLVGPAGVAEDETRWGHVIAELGLERAIQFDGALGRVEVAAAMRRAAVFVHASPHETFGMVAAEALASGLPVAATPSGGVEGIVGHDGRFGEIASDATPDALAEAVLRVLDRRTTFDGAAMRASIEERFSPAAVARRTLELYGELLRADGGNHALESKRSTARSGGQEVDRCAGPAVFVVGFGRTLTVDRIADLPAFVRADLVVVTRGKPDYQPAAPDVGHWLQIDVDGEYKQRLAALRRPGGRGLGERIVGILRSPGRYLRRRRLLADPEGAQSRILAEHLRRAARVAMASHPAGVEPGRVLVVPVEADDVLAVTELAGNGAGAIGGGARHRLVRFARRLSRRGPELVIAPGTMRWLVDRLDSTAVRADGGRGATDRPMGAAPEVVDGDRA